MVNNEDEGGQAEVYGHVMRRYQEYVGTKMMEVTKKEKKKEMKEKIFRCCERKYGEVGAKETDVEDRRVWRKIK